MTCFKSLFFIIEKINGYLRSQGKPNYIDDITLIKNNELKDMENINSDSVIIEERSGDDLLHLEGKKFAPDGVLGLYPCFDITPPELVSAIITDRGIFDANKIKNYIDAKSFLSNQI